MSFEFVNKGDIFKQIQNDKSSFYANASNFLPREKFNNFIKDYKTVYEFSKNLVPYLPHGNNLITGINVAEYTISEYIL